MAGYCSCMVVRGTMQECDIHGMAHLWDPMESGLRLHLDPSCDSAAPADLAAEIAQIKAWAKGIISFELDHTCTAVAIVETCERLEKLLAK